MNDDNSVNRKTLREDDKKRSLINRLKRIEGQIRGLQNMVEKDCYCNDILTQSAAASAALNAFNRDLIKDHMTHCVANDLKEGNTQSIEELANTLQKLLK